MVDQGFPFSAPTLLLEQHDIASFRSGEPSLDEWLRERALANMALSASRTFVSCKEGTQQVVGF